MLQQQHASAAAVMDGLKQFAESVVQPILGELLFNGCPNDAAVCDEGKEPPSKSKGVNPSKIVIPPGASALRCHACRQPFLTLSGKTLCLDCRPSPSPGPRPSANQACRQCQTRFFSVSGKDVCLSCRKSSTSAISWSPRLFDAASEPTEFWEQAVKQIPESDTPARPQSAPNTANGNATCRVCLARFFSVSGKDVCLVCREPSNQKLSPKPQCQPLANSTCQYCGCLHFSVSLKPLCLVCRLLPEAQHLLQASGASTIADEDDAGSQPHSGQPSPARSRSRSRSRLSLSPRNEPSEPVRCLQPESTTEQDSCAICLEVAVEPLRTPCSHTFCRSCVQAVVRTSGAASTCPLCRFPLPVRKQEPPP
mmetsp:Transcript_20834/g.48677  ORF Transcript_20834/g.48677 Transcript_20834/m.48677 type:complete len:366 (+) Transcript_20834:27-1124(+)